MFPCRKRFVVHWYLFSSVINFLLYTQNLFFFFFPSLSLLIPYIYKCINWFPIPLLVHMEKKLLYFKHCFPFFLVITWLLENFKIIHIQFSTLRLSCFKYGIRAEPARSPEHIGGLDLGLAKPSPFANPMERRKWL